jgi:hypothetical protein
LCAEDQRRVSLAGCRRWLREAGFEPHHGRWLVAERDLGQLDPSEVRSLSPSVAACTVGRVALTSQLRRRRRRRPPLQRPPRLRAQTRLPTM